MAQQTKIATCCYCGTRAALVLRGKSRHELACATCGAPLHDLKMLRSDRSGPRELVPPSPLRAARVPKKHRTEKDERRGDRRRSLSQRIMAEMWDKADDVFEEIFDIFD